MFIGEPNQVPKAIPDHLHRVARYGRGQFDAICPLPRWMVIAFDNSGGLKNTSRRSTERDSCSRLVGVLRRGNLHVLRLSKRQNEGLS
jgi:hypothetical protein